MIGFTVYIKQLKNIKKQSSPEKKMFLFLTLIFINFLLSFTDATLQVGPSLVNDFNAMEDSSIYSLSLRHDSYIPLATIYLNESVIVYSRENDSFEKIPTNRRRFFNEALQVFEHVNLSQYSEIVALDATSNAEELFAIVSNASGFHLVRSTNDSVQTIALDDRIESIQQYTIAICSTQTDLEPLLYLVNGSRENQTLIVNVSSGELLDIVETSNEQIVDFHCQKDKIHALVLGIALRTIDYEYSDHPDAVVIEHASGQEVHFSPRMHDNGQRVFLETELSTFLQDLLFLTSIRDYPLDFQSTPIENIETTMIDITETELTENNEATNEDSSSRTQYSSQELRSTNVEFSDYTFEQSVQIFGSVILSGEITFGDESLLIQVQNGLIISKGTSIIVNLEEIPQDGETRTLFTYSELTGSFEDIIVQHDFECQEIHAEIIEDSSDDGAVEVVFNVDESVCETANSMQLQILGLSTIV